jgi:hypothetical protein
MAVLHLTQKDILRSKIITPGWVPIVVLRVSTEPAKSDGGQSMNNIIDMEVEEGEFAQVPLRLFISEKAAGTGMPYLRACGFEIGEEGGDFDLDRTTGMKLLAKVETGQYKGSFQNNVMDFRPRP